MRFLFCSAFTLWLSLSPSHAQTNKYDLSFRHWGQFFAPFEDWHWWKSQAMAESNLNQAARSYCGAIGVMQLMPATATDLKVNPFDPDENIQGGIKYDAALIKMWRAAPTTQERRDLAFASYNAGPGSVSRAAKLAGSPPKWTTASLCLVDVTGPHSTETLQYVARINRFFLEIQ